MMNRRVLRALSLSAAVVAAFAAEVRISPERGGLEIGMVPQAHAINTWFNMSGWNLTIMDCTIDYGTKGLLNTWDGGPRDRWFGCIRSAGGRAMSELGAKLQEGINKGLEQGKRMFDWMRNIRPFGCNIDQNIVGCVTRKAGEEAQKLVKAAKKGWDDLGKWATGAFENARRDLDGKIKGLVGGAVRTLTTWVDKNVLNPAIGMIEGAANGAINWLVDQTVNRLVGSKIMDGLNKLTQQGKAGLASFMSFLDSVEKGDMVDAAVGVLLDWVRDAGFAAAWEHAGGLVTKALEMLSGGIKTGGQALVAALGSVPGAGGLLAGAATVVLDATMSWLTKMASSEIGKQLKDFFTSTLARARDAIKQVLAAGAGGMSGAVRVLTDKLKGIYGKMMRLVKSRVNLGQYRNMAQKLAK